MADLISAADSERYAQNQNDAGAESDATEGGPGAEPESDAGVVAMGVRWFGRVDLADPLAPAFAWSGSGFEASFSGTDLQIELENDDEFVFGVVVDGTYLLPISAMTGSHTYALVSGLPPRSHTVALLRQTEGWQGTSRLRRVVVPNGVLEQPPPASPRLLEVIGDSITASAPP